MATRRVILGTLIAALVSMLFARNVHAQSVVVTASRVQSPSSVSLRDDEIPPPPPAFVLHEGAATPRPSVFPRILLETLVGSAVSAGVFFIGFATDDGALALIGLTSSPFAGAGAVHALGRGMGSHGSFGYTLIGTSIGIAVTIPIALGLFAVAIQCWDRESCDRSAADAATIGFFVSLFAGPTLGAVIGHEVSSANAEAEADRLRLMPGIAPTRDGQGAILSLSGAF